MAVDLKCSFDGCDRTVRPGGARGLCATHYEQRRRGRPLTPIALKRGRSTCTFTGCSRSVSSRGLCRGHVYQRDTGNPLAPIGKFRLPRALVPNPSLPGTFLVPLTAGRFAVIDACDADAVGNFSWQFKPKAHRTSDYAQRIWRDAGKRKRGLFLHRLVGNRMGLSLELEIDHENGDGLDCRGTNLRSATYTQNRCNRGKPRSNTSGIKGVSWDKTRLRWRARVTYCGREHSAEFLEVADAIAFAVETREKLHGAFANHGGESILPP